MQSFALLVGEKGSADFGGRDRYLLSVIIAIV
jgi:hypothetical protein